jgi:hypothetical protein
MLARGLVRGPLRLLLPVEDVRARVVTGRPLQVEETPGGDVPLEWTPRQGTTKPEHRRGFFRYPSRMMRIAFAVWLLLAAAVAGAEELVLGSKAPPFSLAGSDGRTHTLAEHVGKRGVVLAWFPKAFTPG